MSGDSFREIRVLKVVIGGVGRDYRPVAQLVFDPPHI
jgi:hypothetical protein